MMMSSQLTALIVYPFTTKRRTKALFLEPKQRSYGHVYQARLPLCDGPEIASTFRKKRPIQFVWQVRDSSAQLQELHGGNIDIFVGVSKFCLPSSEPFPPFPRPQAISAKLQTPIAGMQKREAWKDTALFGQKLNKIPYILCVVEQNPGDVPNPVGSSRFLSVPIFMHQKKIHDDFRAGDVLGSWDCPIVPLVLKKSQRDPGGLSTSEVKLLSYTSKKYTSKRGYHKSNKNQLWFIMHWLILRIEGILAIGCFTKRTQSMASTGSILLHSWNNLGSSNGLYLCPT